MKKLLVMSSLLLVTLSSYSMNLEDSDQDFNDLLQVIDLTSSIAQDLKNPNLTDKDLDILLNRANEAKAQAKELDRSLNNGQKDVRTEKKLGGKLASLNASSKNFAEQAKALNNFKAKQQKKVKVQKKPEVLKKLHELKIKKGYTPFMESLDKIREERKSKKVSDEEFVLLEKQLTSAGIYGFFRDMKLIEMLFGVRKEKIEAQAKIYDVFSNKLGSDFSHHLNELQVSLKNVKKCLKNDPKNPMLVAQKKLVNDEIKSFSTFKNHASFYRSSIKRSEFDLFKQCRVAVEKERE